MRFLTLITISICSLSLSVKTHAQIEIFGISFGMTREEIVRELDQQGYVSFMESDIQTPFPKQCNQSGTKPDCQSGTFVLQTPQIEACILKINAIYRNCTPSEEYDFASFTWTRSDYADSCPAEFNLPTRCISILEDLVGFHASQAGIHVHLDIGFFNFGKHKDFIAFDCEIFNGCDYTSDEVVRFLLNTLGDQLLGGTVEVHERETCLPSHPSVCEVGNHAGTCMTGLKGDRVCLVGDQIVLFRHKFGEPNLTLSLE